VKGHPTVRKKAFKKQMIWPYAFCAPFIIFYLVFALYPTLYSFQISLYSWNGLSAKVFVGLENYRQLLFVDPEFFAALWNTVLIMIASIPGQIVAGLVLAQLIFNLAKGRRFFQTVYFIPYIIAPVALGIIFKYFFEWEQGYLNDILSRLGLMGEHVYWLQQKDYVQPIVGAINIWRSSGYSMVIFLAAMTAILVEIYDSAKVDGANAWQQFWHITIPQLKNMIVFLILTSIISGFQVYELPSMIYSGGNHEHSYIGGPGNMAYTIIWKFYENTFRSAMRLGYGAAISYSLFAIILVVSIGVRKITDRREREVG
jgi:multiple sugar transport system permease protein/cellobiose transport system permease protein